MNTDDKNSANAYSQETAYWLATLSQLAYEDAPAIKAAVEELGLTRFFEFLEGKVTDTQGFVAANANDIVVAFRSTQVDDPLDYLTDARAEIVDHAIAQYLKHLGPKPPALELTAA